MTTPSEDRPVSEPMTDDDMEADAICAVRERLTNGLGVVVAFIDDHAGLAVLLAQRAVLAGLASDADPETLAQLTAAAEPHRSKHEKALGRPIVPAPLPRRYTGGPLEDGLYLVSRPDQGAAGHWQTLWTGQPQSIAAQFRRAQVEASSREAGFVWLIGPIHIPEIPSEEASS